MYYYIRLLPKILSEDSDFFNYKSSTFDINESKITTARAIMPSKFSIKYFYTIESSIGGYYTNKDEYIHFNT